MHFTRHSVFEEHHDVPHTVPPIVRVTAPTSGTTDTGRYMDGLSGLFTVQVGHGRPKLTRADAHAGPKIACCGPIRPSRAIRLAERLAHYAPGDLSRVFFTTGGGEGRSSRHGSSSQTVLLVGKPTKQGLSRSIAYHGTPQGAGDHRHTRRRVDVRAALVPGAHKVPNTANIYRAPEGLRDDPRPSGPVGRQPIAGDRVRRPPRHRGHGLPRAGPELGRLLPPPPGYFDRVTRSATRSRSSRTRRSAPSGGSATASPAPPLATPDASSPRPDHLRLCPRSARWSSATRSSARFPAWADPTSARVHFGATFSCAPSRWPTSTSSSMRGAQRARPRECARLPGLARAAPRPAAGRRRPREGYFYGIELVKGQGHPGDLRRRRVRAAAPRAICQALFDAGLYCRADDQGRPHGPARSAAHHRPAGFDFIEQTLRAVLTEAENHLWVSDP